MQVHDRVGYLSGAGAGLAEPSPPAKDPVSLGAARRRSDDYGRQERGGSRRATGADGPSGRTGALVAEPGLVRSADRGSMDGKEYEEGRYLESDDPFPSRPGAEGAAHHEVGEGGGHAVQR